jgi:hypothetical protein
LPFDSEKRYYTTTIYPTQSEVSKSLCTYAAEAMKKADGQESTIG